MNRILPLCLFLIVALVCNAKSDPFFFIQLSDTQIGMIDGNKSFDKETEIITRTVTTINRLRPAFVVITGDLINKDGDGAQIAEFKRLMTLFSPSIPIYLVPGNHDVGQQGVTELIDLYKRSFHSDRFSVAHGNTQLIGINSQIVWAGRWELEKDQLDWLRNELEGSKKKQHRILFAHHPLFVHSIDEPNDYHNFPIERRQAYVNLCEKYDVKFLFAGHLHRNNISSIGNLSVVASNAVCLALGSDPAGIRVVKIYPDRVEHEFYAHDAIPESIVL